MFKILNPNEPDHFEHLSQMHNLRHKIFIKNLKWQEGLKAHSQMEFDDFDHPNCRYLVRLNSKNHVDACTRLTLTCFPYLLAEVFGSYIQNEDVPRSPIIVETSRFCADSKSAPGNIAGLIMAAMLELGIKIGIKRYVSLSDIRIIPAVFKYGWNALALGPERKSGEHTCIALGYDVTEEYHRKVKNAVGVSSFLIDQDVSIHALGDILISSLQAVENNNFQTIH